MGACISIQGEGNGKLKRLHQKIGTKRTTNVTAEPAGKIASAAAADTAPPANGTLQASKPAQATNRPTAGTMPGPSVDNVQPAERAPQTGRLSPASSIRSAGSTAPQDNTAIVAREDDQLGRLGYVCPQRLVKKQTQEVNQLFTLGHVLEEGLLATTRLAEEKATGQACRCKSFIKAKLKSEQDVEGVIWEVDIMREHKGHPSAPALKGVYEDDQYLHLITELTDGAEGVDSWLASLRDGTQHPKP